VADWAIDWATDWTIDRTLDRTPAKSTCETVLADRRESVVFLELFRDFRLFFFVPYRVSSPFVLADGTIGTIMARFAGAGADVRFVRFMSDSSGYANSLGNFQAVFLGSFLGSFLDFRGSTFDVLANFSRFLRTFLG